MTTRTLAGSCACGDITYTSSTGPEHLDYCYCITCQQISGAPFMAWMGIPKTSLQLNLNSRPIVYRSTIGDTGVCVSQRVSCGKCGANLILQYDLYPEKTHVAASTITQTDFEIPSVGDHIWIRQCPKWHTIPEDGVQRHEEFDDDFKSKLDEHLKKQNAG